ncbi:Ribosomal RNA small subunit methyltransferase C [Bathymodiolus thermophilus thioautotrophic gill symbiont]|jgi:16S rRNA G1207 methylase RsmC|uniref:Methyltransferase n=1 Tax=Bathymodiolus thermophilus thioautotrophic gill symbiont TaxID=2360 RepID=A0A1J5U5P9_9GAMM|nr:methyltransferase [Bathymodiolus thermophilus thioautotrophic gill symbiont]AYQ57147.1 methyltransferase [Bathymodiolus thermophilus thioautotrophic gill symbiont]OIR24150.1 methyltransferase [Bathymodiolus thermophilus thioautotrophic gill symbiont]CAB5498099.1 16S rRNA (guanine(1207)-N(2))-methyltransferase (EC [Bathymodiolus thermophilus thioautotrophic gill symbiont]SGZ72213.1 Ribosomal RNA small subunit methyltransferase C [Bathymodiolus thermophilus thioautotrophic gill symbiont]
MFMRNDINKLKQDLSIKTNLLNHDLTLKTRWGVFSPRAIDDGTILLMKYVQVNETDKCLDLGCGYGPIGLAVAKSCPKGEVHLVDKDFVAVELSNINAKLNHIDNAKAYLSDAFLSVQKDLYFDQIISNVPAKVGREQLSIILYDAFDALKPGGKITFVTINGLRHFIKDNFKSVFGNYKKLKQGQKYTISQAIKK